MLGYKDLPFDVIQIGEFFVELIKEGKIKIARKVKERPSPSDCHLPKNLRRSIG